MTDALPSKSAFSDEPARRGTLIVVEGADRSGRSTQIELLRRWLVGCGKTVVVTDWSTSPHISRAIHKAKADSALRPITYSLFYAADFADRVANVIVPALQRGDTVVADRYIYTAFARDGARGVSDDWLRRLYTFAPEPDIVFYLRVAPEVTGKRVPSSETKANDLYEFGLDLGLSTDPRESFLLYQQRVFAHFEQLAHEFNMAVIDGSHDVDVIQSGIRDRIVTLVSQCARRGG